MRPKARATDLLVRRLDDEVLVYDLERYRAHCVNPAAREVWELCDGRRTPADIARALSRPGREVTEELVWVALRRLDRASLFEPGLGLRRHRATRRDVLARLAGLGLALPAVFSVVAPEPAWALSGACVSSCSGVADGTCCSGAGACQTCGGGMCMGTANPTMCRGCGSCM